MVLRAVGSDLLSHTVTSAVPSALTGLTTGFGMRPGGPLPRMPPTSVTMSPTHVIRARLWHRVNVLKQSIARQFNTFNKVLSTRRCQCLPNREHFGTVHTARAVSPYQRRYSNTRTAVCVVISPRPLVLVCYTCCHASTPNLSNWWSASGLTLLMRPDI